MRLLPSSGEALLRGRTQWLRSRFEHCALLDDVVTLAPLALDPASLDDETPFTGGFAGLAFDRHCRLFHPAASAGTLEYVIWGQQNSLRIQTDQPSPFALAAGDDLGSFGGGQLLPQECRALACDEADYLHVADAQTPAVWLIDIWQHEVARRVDLAGRALDVVSRGSRTWVLLDTPGWAQLSPCDPLQDLPWPAGLPAADRLDVSANGRAFVLINAGQATAYIVSLARTSLQLAVPFCTDFVLHEDEAGLRLTCARRPGEDFSCHRVQERSFSPLTGLQAPAYDGRGLAVAPDGRIAYWTARGLRHAAPARTQYEESGRVLSGALDGYEDQRQWGSLRLQACIPPGTHIRVMWMTRDDLDYVDALPRLAPAGEPLSDIALPEETPLPSAGAWSLLSPQRYPLYQDSSLRPLSPPAAGGFAWYEAPVIAPPGRYLWAVFELSGNRSHSPRIREARIAFPAHGLVQRLPRTLWREPAAHDFLRRYLAPMAAMLSEWEQVAAGRQRLLHPQATPAEALPWLGSLLGLVVEPCWPETAQRQMISEIARLFRRRGTPWALQRMLEILTGARVILVEKYRLRGGGVIGNAEATRSSSVLGGGFRIGGRIGQEAEAAIAGSDIPTDEQMFDQYAHRFSITLLASLSPEQMSCVRRLVEAHKPAHTDFDICTVEAGTRVGVGLHIGLAAVIGRSSGWSPLSLGESVLGRGHLLGRPALSGPPPRGSCQGEAT